MSTVWVLKSTVHREGEETEAYFEVFKQMESAARVMRSDFEEEREQRSPDKCEIEDDYAFLREGFNEFEWEIYETSVID